MQRVAKEIEINAPVAEVFALFSRFDHFPRWMKGIKSVEWSAPNLTRWTAEAPDGAPLEWEAEVTELAPGRHLAWHSIGGDVQAKGEARFIATPHGTTLLRLILGYALPQQQQAGTSVGAFVDNLDQRLSEDLIWFRLHAEREAAGVESIDKVIAPAAVDTPVPPDQGATEASAVHFDSFSGMLRAGQPIRAARPITAPFDERLEAATVAPPDSRLQAPASVQTHRARLPLVLLGLLLIGAVGLFALSRRRASVAEQPLGQPAASPLASGLGSNSSGEPSPTIVATAPTLVAETRPSPAATLELHQAETAEAAPTAGNAPGADARAAINTTINGWLAATNDKDVDAQMLFYVPVLQRYYLQNNYSRAAVRAEKVRRFAQADRVQVSTGKPEISLAQNGGTARVRFRKNYEIAYRTGTQSGAVLQELVLTKSSDGWRIVSERDLRVLR